MAIDALAAAYGFGDFREKYHGLLAEGQIGHEKVLLLKPQTFMNKSGVSVSEAVNFFKLDGSQIVVFYDELDLPPGKLRMRRGGGFALRARPADTAHVRGSGGGGVPRVAAQADVRLGLRGRAAGDDSRRRASRRCREFVISTGGRLADERAGHGQGVAGARQGTHRVGAELTEVPGLARGCGRVVACRA